MTKIEITGDIKDKKFHFIAIGGIGMSGLAKYLIEAGLLKKEDDNYQIILPFIDYNLKNLLIKNDLTPFLHAIAGDA